MRRTYKPLFWRATRPVNLTDCKIKGRYCLKPIIIDIFTLYFIKYFHSFIQSPVFTGRVARQNIQRLVRSAHDCETGSFKFAKSQGDITQTVSILLFILLPSISNEKSTSVSPKISNLNFSRLAISPLSLTT